MTATTASDSVIRKWPAETVPREAAVAAGGGLPILAARGLCRQFGGYVALDQVDLDIGEGEFVALLGPSGCGKTTLLKLIAGLVEPTAGKLAIGGRDMHKVPANRRPVNTVFQNYALFPHMTVFDNVAFGLRRARHAEARIAEEVKSSLRLVGMEDFIDRYPAQLSGGQQQRVALARAIVNKPAVLLLDEPLSALDLQLRKRMQLELKALQRHLGMTFIFVTHDQDEALTMADRIVVMNRGRIEQIGSGEEIYHRPATRFVAGFVGEANFLQIPHEPVQGTRYEEANSEIMIRPEHVGVSALPPDDETVHYISAEVRQIIFKGAFRSVQCVTAVGTEITALASPAQSQPQIGANVYLSWRADAAYRFGS